MYIALPFDGSWSPRCKPSILVGGADGSPRVGQLSVTVGAPRAEDRVDDRHGRRPSTGHRIRNDGDAAAENLTFEFVPTGDDEEPPTTFDATPVSRLAPRGSLSWPLIAHMGTASQWDVILHWEEDGVAHEDRQTVRL